MDQSALLVVFESSPYRFESFTINGLADDVEPRQNATVTATRQDGSQATFETTVRIDAPTEVECFVNGGILDMVLRQLLQLPSHPSGHRQERDGEGDA